MGQDQDAAVEPQSEAFLQEEYLEEDAADVRPLWLTGWRGWLVLLGGTLLLGAILGTMIGAGIGDGESAPEVAAPTRTPTLPALESGRLVAAPQADPDELDEPLAMGSRRAGIAVVAVGPVETVVVKKEKLRAPFGGSLLAFTLEDGICAEEVCEGWETLKPALAVDGAAQPLPDQSGTYVVALPDGAEQVRLRIKADGVAQYLSLLDDAPGPQNIALFSGKRRTEPVALNVSQPVSEETSIALTGVDGQPAQHFQRQVNVPAAQLRYFLAGQTPSSPANAFLVFNATYSYANQAGQFSLAPGEAVFVDSDGASYPGLDLDPAPEKSLLGFEVPAGTRSGELIVGGVPVAKTSTTGVAYTSTLAQLVVPVTLP